MFIEITKAEYLEGYKLRIHFKNGEIRIADLEASLEGPIFESLKNIEEFRRFSKMPRFTDKLIHSALTAAGMPSAASPLAERQQQIR